MTEPNPADVQEGHRKLTPEFLAATPLQKWGLLALNGLLGTSEPWIDDMRDALRNQEAEIERLRAALQQSRSAVEALEAPSGDMLRAVCDAYDTDSPRKSDAFGMKAALAAAAKAIRALSQESANDI